MLSSCTQKSAEVYLFYCPNTFGAGDLAMTLCIGVVSVTFFCSWYMDAALSLLQNTRMWKVKSTAWAVK